MSKIKKALIVIGVIAAAIIAMRMANGVAPLPWLEPKDRDQEVIALCESIIERQAPAAGVYGSAAYGDEKDGWLVTGTVQLDGQRATYACDVKVRGGDLVAEITGTSPLPD